jgi:hypothetical protein
VLAHIRHYANCRYVARAYDTPHLSRNSTVWHEPRTQTRSRKFSKLEVVKLLVESYAPGLCTEDLKGRVPIRCFAKSCHLDDSLELLEYSFSLDPSLGLGGMGLLLLSHLEECAKKTRNSDDVQKCLDLLRSSNPEPTEAYTNALKRLPRWLNKADKSSNRRDPFRRERK